MRPVKFSIVEDDANLRVLWRRVLRRHQDFAFVSEFGDAESALAELRSNPPDLVLVDWNLPGMDGITLIEKLKDAHPKIRAVLVTAHDKDELPYSAFASGADGFLFKPVPIRELADKLRSAKDGECPISARSARHLIASLRRRGVLSSGLQISSREQEVLRLLADGRSAKQVAQHLRVSMHTVVSHKRRIYKKLDAHNLAQAVARWRGAA